MNFSGGFKVSQVITLMIIAGVVSYLGYLFKEVVITSIQRQKLKNSDHGNKER
jgi:hypothetical protein